MACHACDGDESRKGNEILVCSGEGCNLAYHMRCLQPPLQRVPRGKWLCPDCNTKHKAQRQADRSAQKKARHTAEPLSPYEQQRLDNMARNQAELVKLGLVEAPSSAADDAA